MRALLPGLTAHLPGLVVVPNIPTLIVPPIFYGPGNWTFRAPLAGLWTFRLIGPGGAGQITIGTSPPAAAWGGSGGAFALKTLRMGANQSANVAVGAGGGGSFGVSAYGNGPYIGQTGGAPSDTVLTFGTLTVKAGAGQNGSNTGPSGVPGGVATGGDVNLNGGAGGGYAASGQMYVNASAQGNFAGANGANNSMTGTDGTSYATGGGGCPGDAVLPGMPGVAGAAAGPTGVGLAGLQPSYGAGTGGAAAVTDNSFYCTLYTAQGGNGLCLITYGGP